MHKISTSSLKLYQWQSRDIIYVRELCLWFVFREIYDMKAQSMSKPSSSFFELASFVLPLWLGLIRDTNFFRSGLFKPLSEVVGPVDPLVPCLALSSQRISSSKYHGRCTIHTSYTLEFQAKYFSLKEWYSYDLGSLTLCFSFFSSSVLRTHILHVKSKVKIK